MDEAKANAHNNTKALRRARMSLKVLGLKSAEKKLGAYIELTRELVQMGSSSNKQRATELSDLIVIGPVAFYEELSYELEIR